MLDTFSGNIRPHSIEDEIKDSFLSYAMSVIVSRALPDVRDGLKPVHRRVLYAMHDLGLQPNRPYRKSATVVGEVIGKYHPHGDSAVYDTLVRLARSEEHTSELQSRQYLVCRLLLETKTSTTPRSTPSTATLIDIPTPSRFADSLPQMIVGLRRFERIDDAVARSPSRDRVTGHSAQR